LAFSLTAALALLISLRSSHLKENDLLQQKICCNTYRFVGIGSYRHKIGFVARRCDRGRGIRLSPKNRFVMTHRPIATVATRLSTFIYVVTSDAIVTIRRYCGTSKSVVFCSFMATDIHGNSLSQQKECRGAI
jgi:hypothetical protein